MEERKMTFTGGQGGT
jgi:hypothetical protein